MHFMKATVVHFIASLIVIDGQSQSSFRANCSSFKTNRPSESCLDKERINDTPRETIQR